MTYIFRSQASNFPALFNGAQREIGLLPLYTEVPVVTIGLTVASPIRSPTTGIAADTLYGGSSILVSADTDIVSRDDHTVALTSTPAAWTSAFSGAASSVRYTAAGAFCQTDPASASSARIGPTATLLNGDVSVEFQPQSPLSAPAATEVTLAAIELTCAPTTATLALIYSTTSAFLRFTCTGQPERRIQTGIDPNTLRQVWTKLRLARFGSYLAAFALDGSIPVHVGAFFPTGLMSVRLLTANQTAGTAQMVTAAYRNYSIVGGVWIDGVMARNPTQATTRQLRVYVPPARDVSRAGPRDISVFGPYGEGTAVSGFEYVYPPRATFIDGASTLFSTQDPAVRNAYLTRWKPKSQ